MSIAETLTAMAVGGCITFLLLLASERWGR
jgi:hypothetical protein